MFIGYHDDTAASLVLQVSTAEEKGRRESEQENEEEWTGKVGWYAWSFASSNKDNVLGNLIIYFFLRRVVLVDC